MKTTLETAAAILSTLGIFWMVAFHLESLISLLCVCVLFLPVSVVVHYLAEAPRKQSLEADSQS